MYTAAPPLHPSLDGSAITSLLNTLSTLDYAQSVMTLNALCEQYPGDERLPFLLAGEHASAGKIDLAEAAFMTALQYNPDYAIARFQLGLLQFTSARPAMASLTWSALDRLPQHHPLRLFKTGFEFLARDKTDDAAQTIKKGMLENTSNAPLNMDMQKVLDAIDKLHTGSFTPSVQTSMASYGHSTDANVAPSASEETTEHFLVSAYRNLH